MAIITKPVSEETYRELALGNRRLELHRGQLREKPLMSVEHNDVLEGLLAQLFRQLDRSEFRLRADFGRLRHSAGAYYIPDLMVIPTESVRALRQRPGSLDAYSEPLPLVVEIWSPSTGDYDIDEKLPAYKQRGDLEIWRIHPYERALTAWHRQADGAYVETIYRGGIVQVASLPGVTIDPDEIFAG